MVKIKLTGIEKTQGCHCLAARKRARELTRLYNAALRPCKLRATQFSVLAALAQTGPMPISKLADFLSLERTTLTRIARVMEREARLSMTHGEDKRVRVLDITSEGKRVLAAALPAWKSVQDKIDRRGIDNER